MKQLIEVYGKKIQVYSFGQGEPVMVLLSGSGVPFPSYEYGPLAEAAAKGCRVIGVEKFGYGHSDLAEGDRTIDGIVDEYRLALQIMGVQSPVLLAGHSMGFLEALRWGQRFPAQILGIVGIDPATPGCYRDFKLEEAKKGLYQLSESEEHRKTQAAMMMENFIKEYQLSEEEKKDFEKLLYRNLANHCWISEAENLLSSIALVEKATPYLDIPTLFLLSNGEGTTIEKEQWRKHALDYLSHLKTAQHVCYEYPHNLYRYVGPEMAQVIVRFIADKF